MIITVRKPSSVHVQYAWYQFILYAVSFTLSIWYKAVYPLFGPKF